jgi:Ca2+-binding RTX toxin-like protein
MALISVTVTGAGTFANATYTSNDAAPYSNTLAQAISNALANNTLTPYTYTSGTTAPGPTTGTSGTVTINQSSNVTSAITVPTTDAATVVTTTSPVSISGGAAGQTVIAGSGGLTFTNITPSGPNAVTYVSAGDGNNLISTTPNTTGNYQVNTGAGNDTISVSGNAVVNAGTGNNSISVSGGNATIYSEGFDNITASGTGTDTINIGAGQATVTPGAANLFIFNSSPNINPLQVLAGTGSDTISVGRGGGTVIGGSGGNNILFGGIGGIGSAPTLLEGGGNGDQLFAIGAGNVTIVGGSGSETITGAGGAPNNFSVPGSTGNNLFTAGSGNDTLIAGAGNDTMVGGNGKNSTALMQSSATGADTFQFTNGQAGGHDTITGFKAGDTLQLLGYGLTTPPTVTGGVITLSDGTVITLQNPIVNTPTIKLS